MVVMMLRREPARQANLGVLVVLRGRPDDGLPHCVDDGRRAALLELGPRQIGALGGPRGVAEIDLIDAVRRSEVVVGMVRPEVDDLAPVAVVRQRSHEGVREAEVRRAPGLETEIRSGVVVVMIVGERSRLVRPAVDVGGIPREGLDALARFGLYARQRPAQPEGRDDDRDDDGDDDGVGGRVGDLAAGEVDDDEGDLAEAAPREAERPEVVPGEYGRREKTGGELAERPRSDAPDDRRSR
mmetsp:Transcript_1789/g.6903  ORF Transcript_1789/g.6903 Transcript_1789/m.6903 type:complete len:241 (+) Transcript_1789:848-1570(+)